VLDLVLIAVVLAMTVVTLIYMQGCDALMRTDPTRDEA
jgi:hypothetical protein